MSSPIGRDLFEARSHTAPLEAFQLAPPFDGTRIIGLIELPIVAVDRPERDGRRPTAAPPSTGAFAGNGYGPGFALPGQAVKFIGTRCCVPATTAYGMPIAHLAKMCRNPDEGRSSFRYLRSDSPNSDGQDIARRPCSTGCCPGTDELRSNFRRFPDREGTARPAKRFRNGLASPHGGQKMSRPRFARQNNRNSGNAAEYSGGRSA